MIKIKDFNILYVEDDELARNSLTKFLKLTFENVISASNGKEALKIYDEQLKTNPINLIVTDINMPILSGLEFISVLRQRNDSIPVIFVTARNESRELLQAIELNVSHYLIKPVDLDSLLTKVREVSNLYFLDEKIKKQEKDIKNYIKLIDNKIISARVTLDGKIRHVSRAFCETTGFNLNEVLEKSYTDFLHQISSGVHKYIFKKCIKNESWDGEIALISKDDKTLWFEIKVSATLDYNDKISGFTMLCQNITDKKIIQELSITDALTGIYNRRHFNEFFPKVIKSSKRKDYLVSFLILDVDFFKQYNDTYGHQLGDNILIKVAKSLKDSLKRADDYCFRIGGEEFGVLFKSETKEKAILFANTIKESIENLNLEHSKSQVSSYITISGGLVSNYGSEIEYPDIFYKQADDLLYKAKKNGRNRVEY